MKDLDALEKELDGCFRIYILISIWLLFDFNLLHSH